MKFAFIITDEQLELDSIVKTNTGFYELKYIGENEVAYWVEDKERSLVSFKKRNEAIQLMELDTQEYIRKQFSTFNIFFVSFFEFEVMKAIICNIPVEMKILIDNDYGGIFERENFCRLSTYQEFISLTEI